MTYRLCCCCYFYSYFYFHLPSSAVSQEKLRLPSSTDNSCLPELPIAFSLAAFSLRGTGPPLCWVKEYDR